MKRFRDSFFKDCSEREKNEILAEIREKEKNLDRIKGSLFGGAMGDALGYPIEFWKEDRIFGEYGDSGITEYILDPGTGKALISDDTQMTLFTADGFLYAETRGLMRGIGGPPHAYIRQSYADWLQTQKVTKEKFDEMRRNNDYSGLSWLNDVPELYSKRMPGSTCINAIYHAIDKYQWGSVAKPANDSKGCGGVMRVAPLGLHCSKSDIIGLDKEAAEVAALTHGHSLGFMPASMLTHIISRIVFPQNTNMSLEDIVIEARDTVHDIFAEDEHISELDDIINRAIELSHNDDSDLDNIHKLGEGWVAEETLAIAIYCSLRYQNDFSKGIIAAVNHNGDSDSTGAVTGNILGALLGYDAIEEKWKSNLELFDVIDEMAGDLCYGCLMYEGSTYDDDDWTRKYIYTRWKED